MLDGLLLREIMVQVDAQIRDESITQADLDSNITSLKEVRDLEHIVNLDLAKRLKLGGGGGEMRTPSFFFMEFLIERGVTLIRGIMIDGV